MRYSSLVAEVGRCIGPKYVHVMGVPVFTESSAWLAASMETEEEVLLEGGRSASTRDSKVLRNVRSGVSPRHFTPSPELYLTKSTAVLDNPSSVIQLAFNTHPGVLTVLQFKRILSKTPITPASQHYTQTVPKEHAQFLEGSSISMWIKIFPT